MEVSDDLYVTKDEAVAVRIELTAWSQLDKSLEEAINEDGRMTDVEEVADVGDCAEVLMEVKQVLQAWDAGDIVVDDQEVTGP